MEYIQGTYKAIHDITKAPEFKNDPSNVDKNFSIFITDLFNSIEDVTRIPGPPPEVLARRSKNPWEYFKKLHQMFDFTPWVLTAILGILTSITGVMLDFLTIYMFNMRLKFFQDEDGPLAFFTFYITGFVFASITTAMGALVNPAVDGSGVPELKSIMSGANTYRYLDFNVFFAKFIGMCTAYGAGMQVGRAGPLVHLSAILGNWLLKKDSFKHLDKNYAAKRSILSAAAGCGMSVALGAPITAVIFSVEIVIGFVNTSNIFRTFWAICWSLIATKAMKFFISIDPLNITEFPYYELDFDLISFIVLSILIGLIGVAFLKLSLKLIYLRRTVNSPIFERYAWCWLTYTLLALTHYPFEYSLQSTRLFYNDTYSIHELSANPKMGGNPVQTLTIYMIIKFVTMPFIFSCNIPFGIFGLPLTLGAVFGRWYAEVGQKLGILHPAVKGAYGVVSSAAMLACVVRGVFPAAMLIETTGQIEYGIPICVGVLVGYMVGNGFAMSFFDFPIFVRKLPIPASLMSKELYEKDAQQLMNPAFPFVYCNATHKEIFDTLSEMGEINKALLLPVLNEDRTVYGSVKIDKLFSYLEIIEEQEGERIKNLMDNTRKASIGKLQGQVNRWQNISKFFTKVGTQYEKELHYEGDSRMVKPSIHMKTFTKEHPQDVNIADIEDPVERFYASPMDWNHPRLAFDPSPLTVNARCFASKIQFLFTALKATCIFVTEHGKFIGCVTSVDFLKLKTA